MGGLHLDSNTSNHRLLTPLLNNKTSYEALYNELPQYDHLRVFGCLAMAYNPLVQNDKFAARGIPRVFLGYLPAKKGYRLLNLQTMTEFVSRDVNFMKKYFRFVPMQIPSICSLSLFQCLQITHITQSVQMKFMFLHSHLL